VPPQLIGIYSPARQHGKSTIANTLVEQGYRIHKFAGLLYRMWDALLEEAGVPDMIRRRSIMDLKETPIVQAGGLSFRTFAEGVGTKWGREMFNENVWVDINRSALQYKLDRAQRIVVDDMRFPNEFALIKELGGSCISVVRASGTKPSLPSEGHLATACFDRSFYNDGTVATLQAGVRAWLQAA
jgi:hypothetical protein